MPPIAKNKCGVPGMPSTRSTDSRIFPEGNLRLPIAATLLAAKLIVLI